MAVTRNEFINTSPTAENIQALVSASMVIGLTVSTTDCKLNNYQNSLSQLNNITVDGLNNNNPILITSITPKPEYYYYEIVPFPIVSSFNGNECLETNFSPFLEAIGFDNSNFNVLFNNASSSRASSYLQDVDRKRDAIKPTNIENILDDTALKATVPDSYYSSFAHTLGRYKGSKTSISDYGTIPAFTGTNFEGALYNTNRDNNFICSQSIDERPVATYIFSRTALAEEKNNFEVPNVVFQDIYVTPSANITTDQVSLTVSSYLDIKKGDVLRFGILTYEYVEVTNVTHPSSNSTYFEFNRNYYKQYDPNMSTYSVINNKFTIHKVLGDSIYGTDGNQLYKITDKKLRLEESGEILVIDKYGNSIIVAQTCSN